VHEAAKREADRAHDDTDRAQQLREAYEAGRRAGQAHRSAEEDSAPVPSKGVPTVGGGR
jgi:hypothetical protein